MHTIAMVPYRSAWQAEFSCLGCEVRKVLGNVALRIDHIGSTSVPGLAAKDVIDIQVTVANLEVSIEKALERAGYSRLKHISRDHVPPGWPTQDEDWTKWFFKSASRQRPANLHVRLSGRANQRYPLLFRDYLRTHESVAQAYAQVKTALAWLHPDDIDAYYDVKDPVCDIIMGGAEAWAAQVAWRPGNPDC
jgi:GrpB-like predicted nucleotidyltransferase (UPF0157 family)